MCVLQYFLNTCTQKFQPLQVLKQESKQPWMIQLLRSVLGQRLDPIHVLHEEKPEVSCLQHASVSDCTDPCTDELVARTVKSTRATSVTPYPQRNCDQGSSLETSPIEAHTSDSKDGGNLNHNKQNNEHDTSIMENGKSQMDASPSPQSVQNVNNITVGSNAQITGIISRLRNELGTSEASAAHALSMVNNVRTI